MADPDPIPSDDGISDGLLDACDEAYERWMADAENDVGGIAWDVMSDEEITSQFTARDWRFCTPLEPGACAANPTCHRSSGLPWTTT